MSYAEGFEYDIFINYTREDNQPLSPGGERRISCLVHDLESILKKRLGEALTLHIEEHVRPFLIPPEMIERRLRNSAIFLPFISPSYSANNWAELFWFTGSFSAPHAPNRIVPLEIFPLAEGDYPVPISAAKPIRFWIEEGGQQRSLSAKLDAEEYSSRLAVVADQIIEKLRDLERLRYPPPPTEGGLAAGVIRFQRPPLLPPPEGSPPAASMAAKLPAKASIEAANRLLMLRRQPSPNRSDSDVCHAARIEEMDKKLIATDARDAVEFGLCHPRTVALGLPFLIDAWIFQHQDREVAMERARASMQEPSHFRSGGSLKIAHGTQLTVTLQIPSCIVEPASHQIDWMGGITNASFQVTPIHASQTEKITGSCQVLVNGLRIGLCFFEVPLKAKADPEPPSISPGRMIQSAFASYASKDRRRVLERVQGIQKLAVKVFLDVHDLRTNDHHPTKLLQQIDSSDVLYLFWSRHASRSSWVEREWRHGLKQKGVNFIDPVPLVDPRRVAPPPELAEKHFNDWTLAYLEYEKAFNKWERFRSWLAGY